MTFVIVRCYSGFAYRVEGKSNITPFAGLIPVVQLFNRAFRINIFVKTGKGSGLAEVYHHDIYGAREYKFAQLSHMRKLSDVEFNKLSPSAPDYFFVPRATENKATYEKGFAVNEIFVKNSVCVLTARDELTIHHSKEESKQLCTRRTTAKNIKNF